MKFGISKKDNFSKTSEICKGAMIGCIWMLALARPHSISRCGAAAIFDFGPK